MSRKVKYEAKADSITAPDWNSTICCRGVLAILAACFRNSLLQRASAAQMRVHAPSKRMLLEWQGRPVEGTRLDRALWAECGRLAGLLRAAPLAAVLEKSGCCAGPAPCVWDWPNTKAGVCPVPAPCG